jgi:hypothetical protein
MFPLNAALKRRSSTVFQHAVCVMRGGVLISRARAFDRKGREGSTIEIRTLPTRGLSASCNEVPVKYLVGMNCDCLEVRRETGKSSEPFSSRSFS